MSGAVGVAGFFVALAVTVPMDEGRVAMLVRFGGVLALALPLYLAAWSSEGGELCDHHRSMWSASARCTKVHRGDTGWWITFAVPGLVAMVLGVLRNSPEALAVGAAWAGVWLLSARARRPRRT